MRPVDRGSWPSDDDGAPLRFTRYGDAQPSLIGRIGRYCSYCEMRIDNAPAVEHVSPKRRAPTLECEWDNLLLACVYCNGRKGDNPSPTRIRDYCWPDRDNTFRAYRYLESGEVEVHRDLADAEQASAMRLRALVGLHDRPRDGASFDAGDPRWQKRIRVWQIASDQRDELAEHDRPAVRARVARCAAEIGCWSIWMTVFDGDADMRWRLIRAFRGTAACFDADARPLPRDGGSF